MGAFARREEIQVPYTSVLTRAVCVVCHAGMGITQKAPAHGVPVVAVPFGRDQPEVARRVQVAGAGVRAAGPTASRDVIFVVMSGVGRRPVLTSRIT